MTAKVTDIRPVAPARFTKQGNEWTCLIDMRHHPASRLNTKAYRNMTIAKSNGKLPQDLEVRTNGASLWVSVKTIRTAHLVDAWLDTFISNWADSKL